ncbi:MAG: squalene/phytoene synthase family protein [Elusimicrobia bacterium]|nr:squalene/phytoene synthase family protein [Elusimicrobiota bacterium]
MTQNSGSNFVPSFLFLPKEKQNALTVIYAYCRLTDDIVDQSVTSEDKEKIQTQLSLWKEETLRAFRGESDHPVLQELSIVVSQYSIPQNYFLDLIEGVRMDLEKDSYPTFADLYPYCYRVAGVVGLMCLAVFGYRNPKSREYAVNLGLAFQLTNILRDVRTDADRGRVYIPVMDLRRFDFSMESFRAAVTNPQSLIEDKRKELKNLIRYEIERAQLYYDRSRMALDAEDRSNLVAAEVMRSIYYALLRKIQQNPLIILEKKVRLSKPGILICILRGWLKSKFISSSISIPSPLEGEGRVRGNNREGKK